MRILHIYKDYWPVMGGIEGHVRQVAEAQAALGHQVTVLVTSPTRRTERLELSGVRVIKAGRLATAASAPLSLSLPWHIARERADIAHLHFPYPVGEVANLVFGRARRTVITYHSDVVRQKGLLRLYRPIMLRVLAQADRLVATSPPYAQSSPYLRRFFNKVEVIPLGIDPTRFLRDAPGAAALQERLGSPLLLFVGRLRYYKGLQYMMQAMPRAQGTLVIVGSGPMETAWRQLAQEAGVAARVVFAGDVADEELPAYYQACDLFVLPACERAEGYGLVQLEAMASARPVICTEVGTGTSWVNRDGVTGLVVPPSDPDALAAACVRLISDPALRAKMGAAGRQRMLAELTAERMVDRILDLYRRLLGVCSFPSTGVTSSP